MFAPRSPALTAMVFVGSGTFVDVDLKAFVDQRQRADAAGLQLCQLFGLFVFGHLDLFDTDGLGKTPSA